jgi:hypothetical protein
VLLNTSTPVEEPTKNLAASAPVNVQVTISVALKVDTGALFSGTLILTLEPVAPLGPVIIIGVTILIVFESVLFNPSVTVTTNE